MPIPTQTEMFRVVMQAASDGVERSRLELRNAASLLFPMSAAERAQVTSSGVPVHESREGWAIIWLASAGWLESPGRGRWVATQEGIAALSAHADPADFARSLRKAASSSSNTTEVGVGQQATVTLDDDKSPEELISEGASALRNSLRAELMAKIMGIPSPEGDVAFEQIVTDLLVCMGYGKGAVTRPSGDAGIDGIIRTDPLGFDPVLIQAKRYSATNVVGRPEVQSFAGALNAVSRGAFITTSTFSKQARDYATHYPHADLVLVDGPRLTDLMIDFGLGVATEQVVEVKRLDSDYFARWE